MYARGEKLCALHSLLTLVKKIALKRHKNNLSKSAHSSTQKVLTKRQNTAPGTVLHKILLSWEVSIGRNQFICHGEWKNSSENKVSNMYRTFIVNWHSKNVLARAARDG